MQLGAEAEIDSSLAASLRIMLASPAWVRGDYERAKELIEESLEISREANDKIKIAEALFQLGGTAWGPGDTARAKEIYEEGITLCREVGYTYRLPAFLLSLGYIFMLEGDYERGATLNEEAVAICREHGYKGHLNYALDNLGWAALLEGDYERARTPYEESLMVSKGLGDRMVGSDSLEGMACISAAQGGALRAGRLFGAAQALREGVGALPYQLTPEEESWREPYVAAARSQLGEDSWEEALVKGRAMSLEEAIEYALSTEEHSATTPSSPTGHSSLSYAPEHPAGLTSREIEVLGLVASGMSSPRIAKELYLSPRTVEAHITSIYHKIGVSSRSAATRFALEHNLA